MSRTSSVQKRVREIIDEGERPSAQRLSEELGYSLDDVHRCLNILEKKGDIKSYNQEFLGRRMRMVAIRR